MVNKLAMLALASGLTLSSCMFPAQTGLPREKSWWPPEDERIPVENLLTPFKTRPGKFYRHCDYLPYPARVNDHLYTIFRKEAGLWADSTEFMEFQRWTYKETKEHECHDCLEWRDSTLEVVKDGFIMIPDANRNHLPGE